MPERILRAVLEALTQESRPRRPSEASVQNNVERSLAFRRDYYKYALGIATALLAFSVSLQPTLSRAPEHTWLLIPGWGGLGLAILLGLRLHMLWAKFLITWRNHDNKGRRKAGEAARKAITRSRRLQDVMLLVALMGGVAGVASFAALNLPHIAPKEVVSAAVEESRTTGLPADPAAVAVPETTLSLTEPSG